MGEPVVPLILDELRREPDHWFWALEAITEENPVRPEDVGIVRRMADAVGTPVPGAAVAGVWLTCVVPPAWLPSPGSVASSLPQSPRKTVMFAPYVASLSRSRGPRFGRQPGTCEPGTRSQGV